MDEKKQVKENTKDATGVDTEEGVQSEADKKVAELNADTERINQAIAENENAKAREKLGGRSEGGQTAKPETEDEKWAKDAKERYEGTGMSPVEDDNGK